MIFKYFEGDNELGDFLECLQEAYSFEDLENIFTILYAGYGEYILDEDIKKRLKYPVFESKMDKLSFEK
jgi:hypothetical protein